jgi:hypothetical protein
MDFLEKASARLKHWLEHNHHHEADYESFALQLEEAKQDASAQCIREMIALTQKSSDCLTKALESLENSSSGND